MFGDGYVPPATVTPVEIESLLLRFVDCDVRPGYTYQYRVRLRMWNPNFGQDKLVANPEFAKDAYKLLYSPWAETGQPITVPAESFLYATDVKTYRDYVDKEFSGNANRDLRALLQVKDNQCVIQVTKWMEQVTTDSSGSKREPVGAWVVAEMPVGRGEYVGRKTYVKLPLWVSETQEYALREVPDNVLKKGNREQPKGWLVDFSSRSILVDFDGGRVRTKVRVMFNKDTGALEPNERTVEDDVATELLILRPDGKLIVKSSVVDEADPDRKEVVSKWDKWLNLVKDRKAPTTGGPDDPFNPMPKKGP